MIDMVIAMTLIIIVKIATIIIINIMVAWGIMIKTVLLMMVIAN